MWKNTGNFVFNFANFSELFKQSKYNYETSWWKWITYLVHVPPLSYGLFVDKLMIQKKVLSVRKTKYFHYNGKYWFLKRMHEETHMQSIKASGEHTCHAISQQLNIQIFCLFSNNLPGITVRKRMLVWLFDERKVSSNESW